MPTIGQMIVNNESPDDIRDAIISSLYSKAAERVEAAKPYVASTIFGDEDDEYDDEMEENDEDYDDEED